MAGNSTRSFKAKMRRVGRRVKAAMTKKLSNQLSTRYAASASRGG